MLLYGKHNNVIKWKEHMQTIITELYGIIGMFFTTNERYELPRVSYRDCACVGAQAPRTARKAAEVTVWPLMSDLHSLKSITPWAHSVT